MLIRPIALIAAILGVWPGTAVAQTPAPVSPYAVESPVAITDPFVIPWHYDTMLACMTFTNTTGRVITAIRFGFTTQQENPLGSNPSDAYVDRIGTFAPGVAIRAPAKFMGTVNSVSPALINCWVTTVSTIRTDLHMSVLKVVYADGTVWENPRPQPLASISY